MTRIEFYFNVADKKKLMANLVERALHKHKKVTIFANEMTDAAELSNYLWQSVPESFLPNVMASHKNSSVTPVVIACAKNANNEADTIFQDDLLVNLSMNQPSFFSRFTHFIELVGNDDADKTAARVRYKFYRDRGYEIKHNDHAKLVEVNVE